MAKLYPAALLCAILSANAAFAAGRVELILVSESQQGAEFHQWSEAMSKVGAARVRLRGMEPADEVGIQVQGAAGQPVYVVTGVITSRNELQLPGARFTRSDTAQIARWIADLAANGPPDQREAKSAFGLTASQLEKVKADLAQPVDFATHGLARGKAVQQIGRRLKLSLQVDAESLKALDEDTVSEELSHLACGAALACILRPAGMAMAPQQGRELTYRVVQAKDQRDVWPIGWASDRPARELLPALFESHTVNIQNVSAAQAMEAIAQKVGAPLLVDHNALARHGIEPEKVNVTLPPGKTTTYGLALRRVLGQAKLKSEVRVDEAGTPFVWVTTIKPI